MNNLLFLCTGNYYRSRFCEEYFNYQVQARRLPWRADSRGLAPDITVFRNPGSLSPQTRQALRRLGVALGAERRDPLSAQPDNWSKVHCMIALSRFEHQPKREPCFAADAAVEYMACAVRE